MSNQMNCPFGDNSNDLLNLCKTNAKRKVLRPCNNNKLAGKNNFTIVIFPSSANHRFFFELVLLQIDLLLNDRITTCINIKFINFEKYV